MKVITFIQSQWGTLPRKIINAHGGYLDGIIKKVPTLLLRLRATI